MKQILVKDYERSLKGNDNLFFELLVSENPFKHAYDNGFKSIELLYELLQIIEGNLSKYSKKYPNALRVIMFIL